MMTHEPDEEGRASRQPDPPRAAECGGGGREQGARRPDGKRGARQHVESAQSRALALDQLDDGHGVGRLVTAYTKRFTPMRNAASCNSGGSW